MPKLSDAPKPAPPKKAPGKSAKPADKSKGMEVGEFTGTSTAPARIRFEKGVTKNMGDYNSARMSVSIEVDINVGPEVWASIDDAIAKADVVVTKELERQVRDLDL